MKAIGLPLNQENCYDNQMLKTYILQWCRFIEPGTTDVTELFELDKANQPIPKDKTRLGHVSFPVNLQVLPNKGQHLTLGPLKGEVVEVSHFVDPFDADQITYQVFLEENKNGIYYDEVKLYEKEFDRFRIGWHGDWTEVNH